MVLGLVKLLGGKVDVDAKIACAEMESVETLPSLLGFVAVTDVATSGIVQS